MNKIAPTIYADPGEHKLDEIRDYIKGKVAAGVEVIIIDPITAAASADKPWIEDLRFINEVKEILRGTSSRVILVNH